jgi:DNA invertase Pin-like site-specific DNA recombinase
MTTTTRRRSTRKTRTADAAGQAIAYVRVSTAEQATSGHGLAAQRHAVEREAARRGLDLVATYSDEGISGTKTSRPGLDAALAHAERCGVTLIVPALSRLARSTRLALATIDRLDAAGAPLISCSEQIDTAGPCGRMITTMLAAVAQLERDMIAERTAAALATIRAKGRKTGGRFAPFGFDADAAGNLAPNAREQATLDRIASMHRDGFSLRAIAAALEADGIVTKSGGTRWAAKTVASALATAARRTAAAA